MNETLGENCTFSDIPYTRPEVKALQTRFDDLTRRAKAAGTAEALLQVVRERDALQQEVSLCQSIATIRAFHDVTDAFYQREMQETLPQLEMLDSQSLAMAIAESPFAPAVDEAFGPRLRELLTLDHRIHAEGKELQAKIAQLSAQYQQRVASAKYRVQGETLSGGQLRAALSSPDRSRRKAAFEAQQETVLAQAEEMEALLRELIHARIDLARANGFDNFADYGDRAMMRLGYGRAELDDFCRQVQTHITPIYLRLQEEQRRRLGVDALMPYDRALLFPEGSAVPAAADELPRAARRMYHALGPEAGAFFDEMVRRGLLDAEGSPNKIAGMGFCDMLGAPWRMPFVFANCDGTASDVTVYTHELGHGLQGYLS
ncbi:MAG: M3 family metallopeptidase, partial [Clostridiaceae bacterium]|nr:M3 family metallopeptidase [Clostridiaceae bacterium]